MPFHSPSWPPRGQESLWLSNWRSKWGPDLALGYIWIIKYSPRRHGTQRSEGYNLMIAALTSRAWAVTSPVNQTVLFGLGQDMWRKTVFFQNDGIISICTQTKIKFFFKTSSVYSAFYFDFPTLYRLSFLTRISHFIQLEREKQIHNKANSIFYF